MLGKLKTKLRIHSKLKRVIRISSFLSSQTQEYDLSPCNLACPQKFVGLFSLGLIIVLYSALFLSMEILDFQSFYYLKLDLIQIYHFSILASLIVRFYFSFIKSNYLFLLICALVQTLILIISNLSFISDGGQVGISFISELIKSPVISILMKIKRGSYLPSQLLFYQKIESYIF